MSSFLLSNHSDFVPGPPLSSPYNRTFQDMKGYKYSDCLQIHFLLAAGHGDKVLESREELTPSLLAKTCTWWTDSGVR